MNPQDANSTAPAPAPEQPAVAPAPAPVTPSNGSSKKKLITLIAVISGVVVLAVVGLIVALMMLTVSKEDFKNAYTNANDLRSAYTDMSSAALLSSSSTEAERDNALDSLKESKKTFDEEFKKLEGQKAIQRDGEASELFKALKDKKVKFDGAIAATIESYEFIVLPISEMNDVSASRDTSGIDKTLAAFKESQDKIKDANNKEFVEKMIPLLEKYKTAAENYKAAMEDRSKYSSSVVTEYSSAAREVSTAIRDWSSNFRKSVAGAEIKTEFNKLGEYLAEKASGK